MFSIAAVLPPKNLGVLAWFPRSMCWFSVVYDGDHDVFYSFGGGGDLYNERPSMWTFLPDAIIED